MNRFRAIGGILLLVLVFSVAAQVPINPYSSSPSLYNPYLGKPLPQPAVNPLTGRGWTGQQTNPLTGNSGPAINPLTGKPMPANPVANPLMGRGAPADEGPIAWPSTQLPMTGKAGRGLEALDKVIMTIMERHGIPGASAAIARNGKLVYARGFGWSDLGGPVEADPGTLFGLASLSKPLTAMAVLLLVDQGKLDLDARAFALLKHLGPPRGGRVIDARIYTITVRQLLNHTGGWDRSVSGEPMNLLPQMARAMRVPQPLSPDQFISYMMTARLDFAPGSKMAYSNLGYVMLGRIIEKVSGQSYESFVRKNVLEPSGVRRSLVSEHRRTFARGEARTYLAGSTAPFGPMDLATVKAAAGWSLTPVDLVRVLTRLDGSRGKPLFGKKTFEQMIALPPAPLKRREDGTHNGLGWPTVTVKGDLYAYFHDGMMHGMRTFMKRNGYGVNWALLFNISMQPDEADAHLLKKAVQEIHQYIETLKELPDVDLFMDFP